MEIRHRREVWQLHQFREQPSNVTPSFQHRLVQSLKFERQFVIDLGHQSEECYPIGVTKHRLLPALQDRQQSTEGLLQYQSHHWRQLEDWQFLRSEDRNPTH